jgi:hypothetical protein
MKPNNTPLYVHAKSNHPPSTIRNIPESINKRLSSISSNETVFNKATSPYQEALIVSGYNYKLKYTPPPEREQTESPKNRKRKITWFNPPYSTNVSTNVGRKFFRLINKCFPPGHILRPILNRNTIKLSYSCMPNMLQRISVRNKCLLSQPAQANCNNCNCKDKAACPLDGNCLTPEVIYQASVARSDTNTVETYIGLTENKFKTRYNSHKSSFKNNSQRNATALSKYIWSLKDSNITYSIKWKLISRSMIYSTCTKRQRCNLCLEEKYFIITRPDLSSLNNRNELATSCRHRRKHLLSSLK